MSQGKLDLFNEGSAHYNSDRKHLKDLEKVKSEFYRIKNLGFIKDNRPNNKDGGIGNTFEDHLGVNENNLKDPDFLSYEVKTQRQMTSSKISMFSKAPSYPRGANAYLKDNFGDYRDPNFPNIKKLYASIFGHRKGDVYGLYQMQIVVKREQKKLYLNVWDTNDKLLSDVVYWNFADLRIASGKMKNLIVVSARKKMINTVRHYHYTNATIYHDFNFDKFITAIDDGFIQFDIRMGIHGSGKNYGKPHDHGGGFRINKENFAEIFDEKIIL